ncbi:MAG: DUF2062 domain-containing protein [Alcanivoracaceae bacterium]|jgi:hypothetical protein
MPKHLFKKYLPSPESIRRNRSLHFLGEMLTDPNLWHINRHSLAGAAFIGIFCALLPIPLQMVVAAVLALRFKCNLPLSMLLVWFTNPLTYVPVFYFTYRVGAWMLGSAVSAPESVNVAWLLEQLIPLWLGSVACGLVFGLLGWATVKVTWRYAVVRSWRKRQRRRNGSSDISN